MTMSTTIYDHLASGVTTVCRAWSVTRRDGSVLGFTDHDCDLSFEGVLFKANTGLTARALQQTTGLSVDNSEAQGALSDASITEADILAGRFDGADVVSWLVNWTNPSERVLQFRGSFGEIVRSGGAFQAELRGLAEKLNQPQGRVYQKQCSAILGDTQCSFDLATPGFIETRLVEDVSENRIFRFSSFLGFDDRWFERGRLEITSGEARGLCAIIKNDRLRGASREIELWQEIPCTVAPGDSVLIEAGCDKRAETCRLKFGNFLNFRGFPHIPGEDWLSAYPKSDGVNDGGSLKR